MNVILEGLDAAGKTTLANKLCKKYNMSVIHSTAKTRNDLHYHIDLLDYRENTVFDRFHCGEFVFPKVYNRPEKLNLDEFTQIEKRIIDNNDMFIIFIASDMDVINQRLIARGEDDYLQEMAAQNEWFTKYIERFNRYHYKNFYVIDVSKPGCYDKLDKWIDKHFGKITPNIAYRNLTRDLLDNGHPIPSANPRGTTSELCNYQFVIDDITGNECITLKTGGTNLTYVAAEILWYGSSRNDLDFITKFSKFWNKVSDDGVTANSAYGYILQEKHGFNQIETIIDLLKKDPNSRRAVLNINVPNPNVATTKDEMCTICLNYQIRDGKLHSTCVMRSNDFNFGLRNDVAFFLYLQKYIANKLGVAYGTYTHYAFSMHMYDRDFTFAKDVAYGTLETSNERLDIDKLIEHKDELIKWVDESFTTKDDFTTMLKDMNIIYEV